MNNTYILCSDDNIILKHNDDTNKFMLSFDVLENYNNILEIIKDNLFFSLMKELNSSIITDYNGSIQNNINHMSLKIITPKDFNFKNTYGEHIILHFSYMLNINDNETIFKNIDIQNKNNTINNIYFNNFEILVKKIPSGTTLTFNFTFDENVNDTINKFIALYFKKILKNFKKYFDMV